MDNPQKLTFPIVARVQLHDFTLYRLQPNISVRLPKQGVFCLAGANGLGKSTFLATLNYGLTGVIPNLKDRFFTSGEYYEKNYKDKDFTKNFFTGRIDEDYRPTAAISVELHIGLLHFKIKRYLLKPDSLVAIEITNTKTGELEYEGGEHTTEKNESEYKKRLCAAMGIGNFEQYVFLQHFVLTFDESHRLLLWDPYALNEALYLCIGADYNKAKQVSDLTREMERAGSRARNTQFHASNVRGRIAEHKKALAKATEIVDGNVDAEDIVARHQALMEELDKLRQRVRQKQYALQDSELKWIDRSAKLTSLQSDFEREFSRRIENQSQLHFHPTISATLSENKCAICHTEGVASAVQEKLTLHQCPLCNSKLPPQRSDEQTRLQLRELDAAVAVARNQLKEIIQTKDRLVSELQASKDSEKGVATQLQEFENANERILQASGNAQDRTAKSATIEHLEKELNTLIQLRDEQYEERDTKKSKLVLLQKGLQRTYAYAQETFVPLFQKLAAAFLGVELEVELEARTTIADFGISLIVAMRGSTRRDDTQLSESQRFFLDIALRMALAQYMSDPTGKAELLIDTPEGSLDIAYEARAGGMFAEFVATGHNLFITANINSSMLLLRLAKKCGKSMMTLHRMTGWTELSDIQADSEELFQKAYSAIEVELEASS